MGISVALLHSVRGWGDLDPDTLLTHWSGAEAGYQLGPECSLWKGQLCLAFTCGRLASSQYGGLVPGVHVPQGFICKLLLLM